MTAVDAGEHNDGGADSEIADRGRRLFEFLAQTQRLKHPPRPTTDAYESVYWLAELPDHPAVRVASTDSDTEPDAPVLTVDRLPQPVDPPAVPGSLAGWLDGPTTDPGTKPALLDDIPNPAAQSSDHPAARFYLADYSDVEHDYEQWTAQWTQWSEKEVRDRPVRALYKRLFTTSEQARAQIEEYELVLGTGQLNWTPENHGHLSRHLLTFPMSITRDDSSGKITVAPEMVSEPLQVELDMLDPSLTRSSLFNELRSEARGFEHHPLARSHAGELARRLVNGLHPDANYSDSLPKLPNGVAPRAAFAPAIILRRRTSFGLIKVFEDIAEEVASSGRVPEGLLPLVDPDFEVPTQSDPSPGAIVTIEKDEVFLPLPLNERQLEVVHRADTRAQTLVQGPPGTGKTHTAAALVTHLLAQGKRVLVTAHTDRALQEVRSKLPDAINPLAVSVLGTDRTEMANLRTAVAELSSRSADHAPAQAQESEKNLLSEIDKLRRERAQLHRGLVESRSAEVETHEHAGFEGSLAQIAQSYQVAAASYDWIVEYAMPAADATAPLEPSQAGRWLTLIRDAALFADESESAGRLPELDSLPPPEQFASLVEAESDGSAGSAIHTDLTDHPAYEAVTLMSQESRNNLQERMRSLAREASALEERDESWMNDALHDIRAGKGATWRGRADAIATLVEQTRPFVERLGLATDVQIAAKADLALLANLARALYARTSSKGALKTNADGSPKLGTFSSKAVKGAGTFFASVQVNGQVPTTPELLATFLNYAEAVRLLEALTRAWPADVVIPEEDTLHERLQWQETELAQLHRLLAFGAKLREEEGNLARAGMPHPNWNDIASVVSYARLIDAADAHDRYITAAQPLQDLERQLATVTEWSDAADASAYLQQAVLDRERSDYADAYGRAARLHEVRRLTTERDALSEVVRSAFPGLIESVNAAPDAEVWPGRMKDTVAAWDWARTGSWLRNQDSVDINVIQAQIAAVESKLRHDIEKLAATRAWNHAVSPSRLTGRSRADLAQYVQLVRRLGKGTGKYAPRRRVEIRKAMDQCRPAVPVWIMPTYRITEQLRVSQNMFDVVIVDEASQAGLETAFLQYLAPKIVVIGDDKQVSPAAVGQELGKLDDLANQYLFDSPYKATWQNPQLSLFDLAAQRFRRITLVEHRRCVPEIIEFSNRIAYEPENVRLIPVRQYGADRLEPVQTVHVEDGYEVGSSSSKTNPAEIDAVVDQIQKCLADPQYDGRTLGVISLVGARQARQIEAALIDVISPEEWAARDLRCGDAADFQGSERDVMFLSMVSAPAEGRRAGSLTREMNMQRFNVAVSRAKDQLWLFHSLTLEDVPNSEDMRHQLLAYCQGVVERRAADVPESLPVSEDTLVEPFDSLFEQRVYNRIVDRGYLVEPQYDANGYRIDLVVIGARGRLAVECDGDAWHGPEVFERDLARQRDLERCGWTFFRIRESAWYTDQHAVLQELWSTLDAHNMHPIGWRDRSTDNAAHAPPVADAESTIQVAEASIPIDDQPPRSADPSVGDDGDTACPPRHRARRDDASTADVSDLPVYREFRDQLPPVMSTTRMSVIAGLAKIVDIEGPVTGARLHRAYVTASGGRRVGKQIAHELNKALTSALRQAVLVDVSPAPASGLKDRTFAVEGQPTVSMRRLGPRTLEEVPPLELASLLYEAARRIGWDDTELLYRTVLHRLGRNRLTGPASELLTAVAPLATDLLGELNSDPI